MTPTLETLARLSKIADRYLHDDAGGDLDTEKWGEAMPPGDVVWLIAEVERQTLRADTNWDSYKAAEKDLASAQALAREAVEIGLQWAAHLRDLHGNPRDRARLCEIRAALEGGAK